MSKPAPLFQDETNRTFSGTVLVTQSQAKLDALRVFLVEDNALIIENLVSTLEEMTPARVIGSAVDEATAKRDLACAVDQVDVIIIDIFLKGGSGLGVLRWAMSAGFDGRCVVLTNYATSDMREKCQRLGATRVFDKSKDLDQLLAYCKYALDQGRNHRQGQTASSAWV